METYEQCQKFAENVRLFLKASRTIGMESTVEPEVKMLGLLKSYHVNLSLYRQLDSMLDKLAWGDLLTPSAMVLLQRLVGNPATEDRGDILHIVYCQMNDAFDALTRLEAEIREVRRDPAFIQYACDKPQAKPEPKPKPRAKPKKKPATKSKSSVKK